jgi:hypothetical protein
MQMSLNTKNDMNFTLLIVTFNLSLRQISLLNPISMYESSYFTSLRILTYAIVLKDFLTRGLLYQFHTHCCISLITFGVK